MFSLERWHEIFETLNKNRLRTFLTALSVASGIFILVILLGVSTGIQKGVQSEFEQDAANRISVWTGTTTKEYNGLNPGRYIQLKNEDHVLIESNYDDYLEYRTPIYSIWGGAVSYKDQNGTYRVEGAFPDQQFIENETMVQGRFIAQSDLDRTTKVAVIGHQMKRDLFKNVDPIGTQIDI